MKIYKLIKWMEIATKNWFKPYFYAINLSPFENTLEIPKHIEAGGSGRKEIKKYRNSYLEVFCKIKIKSNQKHIFSDNIMYIIL